MSCGFQQGYTATPRRRMTSLRRRLWLEKEAPRREATDGMRRIRPHLHQGIEYLSVAGPHYSAPHACGHA